MDCSTPSAYNCFQWHWLRWVFFRFHNTRNISSTTICWSVPSPQFGVSLRIFLEAILKTFYKEPYDIADSAVATLHCMTLTVVLFSLELIHMSHSSSENGRSGFSFCKHKQFSVSALFVVSAVSKTFLLLYTATLPFWKTDPVFLSVSSSMVTGFFALSRMITTNYQLMARRKGTPEEVRKSMLDDFSMMSSSHNSMSDSAEIDNNIVSA